MRIAKRIHQLCKEAGLSTVYVEEAAGLPPGYIDGLASGQDAVSCETLRRLGLELGVPYARFFFDDGERVSTPRLTPAAALGELAQDCRDRRPLRALCVSTLRRVFKVASGHN